MFYFPLIVTVTAVIESRSFRDGKERVVGEMWARKSIGKNEKPGGGGCARDKGRRYGPLGS